MGACHNCGELGHFQAQCPHPTWQGDGAAKPLCGHCHCEGHDVFRCPVRKADKAATEAALTAGVMASKRVAATLAIIEKTAAALQKHESTVNYVSMEEDEGVGP